MDTFDELDDFVFVAIEDCQEIATDDEIVEEIALKNPTLKQEILKEVKEQKYEEDFDDLGAGARFSTDAIASSIMRENKEQTAPIKNDLKMSDDERAGPSARSICNKKLQEAKSEEAATSRDWREMLKINDLFLINTFCFSFDLYTSKSLVMDWDHRYHFSSYSWSLDELLTAFIEHREHVSKTFPLPGYPFSAQLKLNFNNFDEEIPNFANVSLRFVDKNKVKMPLPLSINPRATLCLKTEDETRLNSPFSYLVLENEEYGKWVTLETLSLAPMFEHKQASFALDLYVEPPKVAHQAYSHEGHLSWYIENYHEKKALLKDQNEWFHESPYFYTKAHGFRVQALIRLGRGYATRTEYMSIQIRHLKSAFDDQFPDSESFIFKITVTVFNKKNAKRSTITQSLEKARIINNSCPLSIHLGTLRAIENVVENNTLFYKVSIEDVF